MASNKLKYDSVPGSSVELPTHIPTYRYAAESLEEIKQLLSEIQHPSNNKLAFQTLPKHMRRRAMSHHPNRLPRKYRGIHRSQMAKAGKPQQSKRPSRKYRRKPSNLLKEYIRRQRKNNWLETHIWHAKRFRMLRRWGYCLPYASYNKMYRVCYRATAEHCLLQDISFYACIELEGTLTEITSGFAKLSSAHCGLTIKAITYLTGRREGSLDLFRINQYPEGALGRVMFMWKTPSKEADEKNAANVKRILWVWVHPCGYHAIIEELIKSFELISMKSIKVPIIDETKEEEDKQESAAEQQEGEATKKIDKDRKESSLPKKRERRLQFMTRTFAYERIKRYRNANETLVMSELKDTMNRFRLTGPLAHSVLAHAFKVASTTVSPATPSSSSNRSVAGATTASLPNWFHDSQLDNAEGTNSHQMQKQFWQDCSNLGTPSLLMSNMIVALNIEDPRLNRPQKRSKAKPHSETPFPELSPTLKRWLLQPPPELAHSYLWEANVRDRVAAEMLSTHAYCEKRAQHAIVPGAACPVFERHMVPLPVVLVQRPGSRQENYKRLSYGCGWDVIAPAGCGMSIWLALIMWGAKAGGLRELSSVARELAIAEFLPDTVGGQQDAAERYLDLRTKYFRMPPNKRCNYRKFSIVSPFRAPFCELVRDWSQSENVAAAASSTTSPATASSTTSPATANTTTTTTTTTTTPTTTTTITTPTTTTPTTTTLAIKANEMQSNFFVLRDRKLLQQLQNCILCRHKNAATNSWPSGAELSPKCILQMQFLMKTRGNPGDFALICIPTLRDLKCNLKRKLRENHKPVWTEPLRGDPNEKERKVMRINHKKLLKRLRNKRVREKRKLQQTSNLKVRIRPAGTGALVAAQRKRMCELWLPELSTIAKAQNSIREQCSRPVCGYITNCSFSYVEARVCGVGYVTAEGLRELLNVWRSAAHVKQPLCLLRGTNTRHYRFATFKLNLQV